MEDRDVPLPGEELLIGSGEDADLRLTGADIASAHASVVAGDGRWLVTPVDGTLVLLDGEAVPVYGASLDDGAAIGIGPHRLVFRTARTAVAIDIAGERLRVGRAADNDVVLEHPAVDAHHAELTRAIDGVRLRDLSSTSGTRLNGQLITAALLADGDELSIGRFSWTYAQGRLVPRLVEEPPLRAEKVGATVGSNTLLRPTDLVVEEGELIAVVGPSGAGKSTLLHILAGLRRPSVGRVLMRGSDVFVRQADLGFVAQDDALHGRLTPREALTFAAQLRLPEDTPSALHDEAVARVLANVDLTAAADRPIASLSGGQRKRVALAQELISEPAVLLLDEPTSGLDPGLEHRMMLLLRELAAGHRSVVVVTHNVSHLDVCDRLAVMAPGGAVVQEGAPRDVLAAFGVASYEEIFEGLETVHDEAPVGAPVVPRRSSNPSDRVQVKRRRVRPQTVILTRRYALLMLRDQRNLRLLLIQALALSAGAALLFGTDVFAQRDGGYLHAGESAQLLFLMVTMAIWFGAISSARQIVSERTVLTRDLATGVRTESYLLSKVLVLGALGASQTALMALIVFTLRPLHGRAGDAQTVVLILLLCCLTGLAFGLVVSAYARSEDQATSYIPLVLLPQLLFGGAVVPTAQLSGFIAAISHLAAAQWGFAAAGHAIDMSARIAGDPVFAPASRYGPHFFALGTAPAAIALFAFIAASAIVLQARLRPSFEDTWWQQLRVRLRQGG